MKPVAGLPNEVFRPIGEGPNFNADLNVSLVRILNNRVEIPPGGLDNQILSILMGVPFWRDEDAGGVDFPGYFEEIIFKDSPEGTPTTLRPTDFSNALSILLPTESGTLALKSQVDALTTIINNLSVKQTPYYIPPGETFIVQINSQVLLGMALKNDGFIINRGFLVEV